MENNKEIQDSCKSLQSCVSVSVTELRIGNYVIYNNKEIGTITGVQYFLFNNGKVAINQRVDIFYHTENIKPIPLTEEWLLKFGFEKELDSIYRRNQSHMIEFIFYDEGLLCTSQSVCLNKIKSVHQLQNLYSALTGSELQISPITEH